MRRTPDRPSIRPAQTASWPMPIGVMPPTPVTATRLRIRLPRRRSSAGGELFLPDFGVALDVLRRFADGPDLFRLLIRDLQGELILQSHHELDDVERIRPQILDEPRLGRHLIGLHAELIRDDRLHAFEHRRRHFLITPLSPHFMTSPPSTFRTCPVI